MSAFNVGDRVRVKCELQISFKGRTQAYADAPLQRFTEKAQLQHVEGVIIAAGGSRVTVRLDCVSHEMTVRLWSTEVELAP